MNNLVSNKNFPIEHKPSFESLVDTFLSNKDLRESSKRAYLSSFLKFADYLKSHCIKQVTELEIKEYKESLISRKLSVFTIISHVSAIKSLFSFMAVRNLYPDIARDIKVPKKPRGFSRDPLTKEQAKGLIKSAIGDDIVAKRDYAIINTLLRCGLRSIEIIRADIGDIRQSGGTPVLWVQGKGRDSKDEFVVLTTEALDAINNYLVLRGNINLNEPLFVSHSPRNKNGRLATRSIRRIVKQYLSECGINNKRLTCHSLRHTFATLALANHAPLLAVQQAMRHSNINTTMIYTHMIDRLENGAEKFIDL